MGVRQATFSDVPRMRSLMEEMCARSVYAGRTEIDKRECFAVLTNAIQRHGMKNAGGTMVMVAEAGGVVEGFIIGVIDRVYHVGVALMVTDLFFITSERAEPQDAYRMLKALIRWGEENPKVIEVRCGVTGIVGNVDDIGALYARAGMNRVGAFFEKGIAR